MGLNQQIPEMTLKPEKTSDLFKVTSSIIITMNLEFNSSCRKKKHSLKDIDVTRTTHTNLDVLQESRIDDYRNIEQKFVRFFESIHKIHSIERKTSQRKKAVQRDTDKSSGDH